MPMSQRLIWMRISSFVGARIETVLLKEILWPSSFSMSMRCGARSEKRKRKRSARISQTPGLAVMLASTRRLDQILLQMVTINRLDLMEAFGGEAVFDNAQRRRRTTMWRL